MSKEFEAIVLNKLENLELEMKNTNSELKNLAEGTNQRLGGLETEVKETKDELKNLTENTNQRLGSLEIELKDTKEIVKYLNNNFTKFDFEINRKIDTLFDANTINKEKHDIFEEKIVSLDEKSFNHGIRISNLEDKVLTA